MRAHVILAASLAVAGASCFAVEPLPDCADPTGLYLRHHVCMPFAGPPIEFPAAPREIVVADFDDEGLRNDLAVLLDPDQIQVYTGIDLSAPTPAKDLTIFGDGREVAGLVAARYFDGGVHGEDLILWIASQNPQVDATGAIVGLRNGGDVFAADDISVAVLLGNLLDEDSGEFIPIGVCPFPNGAAALYKPDMPAAEAIVVSCATGPTGPGPLVVDVDAIQVTNDGSASLTGQFQFGLAAPYVDVHAGTNAAIDKVGLPDLVFAHRPPGADHDELVILFVDDVPMEDLLEIEPIQGSIDQIIAEDIDQDADIDLVVLHTEKRGFSVIRQTTAVDGSGAPAGPIEFDEPDFYSPYFVASHLATGDFTGDGGLDIAVAHVVDNTSLNAISLFVRNPDLAPGTAYFSLATVGFVDGTIVDLDTLDFDGDGRVDLAAAVRSGAKGYVYIYLNRSPGDE